MKLLSIFWYGLCYFIAELKKRERKKTMENTENSRPTLEQDIKLSVRALLVAHNIKQSDIAKKYFLHPSSVNRVIQGRIKTPYIRKIIAQVLGKEPQELWNDA
jgi:lambda repressor-like predicted transcriptional regulator